MTDAQFAWVHLIAAIVLGLSMGWNVAIHVWNTQAKKVRPTPDPLRLQHRRNAQGVRDPFIVESR